MKLAVASVLFLLLPCAIAGAGVRQDHPQRAVVSVALTTASVRDGYETRTDVLLVWNRNIRSTPIGHVIKACIKAGQGGILGGGLMSCTMTLQMPTGKISAAGIVHSLNRYTLVITGGTREYEGVSGPLFVRREADGVRRLTFTIG